VFVNNPCLWSHEKWWCAHPAHSARRSWLRKLLVLHAVCPHYGKLSVNCCEDAEYAKPPPPPAPQSPGFAV
jgi:hypothetical protein